MKPWLTALRRRLHAHPELGGQEAQTRACICETLDALGVSYTTSQAHHGVVALIAGRHPGRTVALRADMDALPILEQTRLPFASQIPGVMHACGHDAHMAILLGVARFFAQRRDMFSGAIKLLFEPAEETTGGARVMVQEGCLQSPAVSCVLGLHVMPELPVGHIATRHGAMSGASDDLTILVRGEACHGAYPEKGHDAILIAAHIVTALQAVVSRAVSPLDSVVLTLGTIQGGTAANIIAGEVRLTGTLRTLDAAARTRAQAALRAIVPGIAAAMGGSAEVAIHSSYRAVINDARLTDALIATARAMNGPDSVTLRAHPSLGVESFGFFLSDGMPGVYYDLGCGNAQAQICAPIHTPAFQIDEDCLCAGVSLQAALAEQILEGACL